MLGARGGGAWVGWAIALVVRRWHRDKLFLYEIDVVERARRQGVGTSLICALRAVEGERELASTFVLTHASNEAAMAFYAATGAHPGGDDVLWAWWDD